MDSKRLQLTELSKYGVALSECQRPGTSLVRRPMPQDIARLLALLSAGCGKRVMVFLHLQPGGPTSHGGDRRYSGAGGCRVQHSGPCKCGMEVCRLRS